MEGGGGLGSGVRQCLWEMMGEGAEIGFCCCIMFSARVVCVDWAGRKCVSSAHSGGWGWGRVTGLSCLLDHHLMGDDSSTELVKVGPRAGRVVDATADMVMRCTADLTTIRCVGYVLR
jgi:hypothetical protein